MTSSSDAPRPPRQSSSVILVRQGARDVEAFMVHRSPKSEFAASVYVFPGGGVRADDTSAEAEAACGDLTPEAAHAVFSGRGAESVLPGQLRSPL